MKKNVKHPQYRKARQGASWLLWAVLITCGVIVLTASTPPLTTLPY